MNPKRGKSKYILGHVGYTEIAELSPGKVAVVVLNPEHEDARQRASASVKASVSQTGKRCKIETQQILMPAGAGVWKESCIMTVEILGANQ